MGVCHSLLYIHEKAGWESLWTAWKKSDGGGGDEGAAAAAEHRGGRGAVAVLRRGRVSRAARAGEGGS
jgi:hypothetical protein